MFRFVFTLLASGGTYHVSLSELFLFDWCGFDAG